MRASSFLFEMAHYKTLPFPLYHIRPRLPVSLRSYEAPQALGRRSLDLKLHDGLVQPMPIGSDFHTPNGMSLRPRGDRIERIINGFKSSTMVYRLEQGMTLPDGLIVFHEHTDHYSIQTTRPVTLEQFNATLTALLKSTPNPQTKDQFLEYLADDDDMDN